MRLFSLVAVAVMLVFTTYGRDMHSKRTLKTNGTLLYNELPKSVDSLDTMFLEGKFYGRIRSNSFLFWWRDNDRYHNTHVISGLGGSVVYKSASYKGFDVNVALYYSHAFFNASSDPFNLIKAGKDVGSRYDYFNAGNRNLAVLGEANLHYRYKATDIVFGRQLLETFYTKSNDTKMVPNTFDGFSIGSKALRDTEFTLAYLYAQKLRDHSKTHNPFMYGDGEYDDGKTIVIDGIGVDTANWSGNDDSAMHRGLSYSALKAAGKPTDAALITGDLHNRSVANLQADLSFYVVQKLLSQVMGECNYAIDLDNGITLVPAIRYIKQFDNGAGKVGGASLGGEVNAQNPGGYDDPDSLEAQMVAARIVAKIDDIKLNLAYTDIFDEADLVTPWRGFPTAGYTRSMGTYNWKAATKSYRLEFIKGANADGIYKEGFFQASILYVDADEEKGLSDKMYYYFGIVHNLPKLPELQWRMRIGYAYFLEDEASNFDYVDSRFEINYLF